MAQAHSRDDLNLARNSAMLAANSRACVHWNQVAHFLMSIVQRMSAALQLTNQLRFFSFPKARR